MFCIGFEIGHFNHHSIWSVVPVGAKLCANPLARCVKDRSGNITKLIDVLRVVTTVEDGRQIGAFLLDHGFDGLAAVNAGVAD